jgi:hypothetical protein
VTWEVRDVPFEDRGPIATAQLRVLDHVDRTLEELDACLLLALVAIDDAEGELLAGLAYLAPPALGHGKLEVVALWLRVDQAEIAEGARLLRARIDDVARECGCSALLLVVSREIPEPAALLGLEESAMRVYNAAIDPAPEEETVEAPPVEEIEAPGAP